jgi:protein-S-isoprenylcysteine O-methyltransferase Ste14
MDVLLFALQVGAFLPIVFRGSGISFFTGGTPRSVTLRGVIGNALTLTAMLLMFWTFSAFRSWRLLPVIEGRHELCTTGPFRLVRHPLYLSFNLLGIGVAIAVPTPLTILGAGFLLIGTEIRARIEERVLLAAFGEPYRRYMRSARRVIPGIY